MSRHPHTVSWWRLLLRALSYHRGQTIAVALVTAMAAEVCDARARLHEGELDWVRPFSG